MDTLSFLAKRVKLKFQEIKRGGRGCVTEKRLLVFDFFDNQSIMENTKTFNLCGV